MTHIFFVTALLACSTTETPTPSETPEPSEAPAERPVEAPAEKPAEKPADVPAEKATRVNLNTADRDTLAAIPGMTPKMVHEFEEYRPYVSINQFRKEIGKHTDDAQVRGWESFVFVPVEFNKCDVATLMQLPGVTKPIAKTLMQNRPYPFKGAFLISLVEMVGQDKADAGSALVQ
jgi:DNA uptake protein ComE-like DNA-binding protein